MLRTMIPIALVTLSVTVQAYAADGRTCDTYALAAVRAAEDVREKECGMNPNNPNALDLNHPQWSLDITAHRRWCLNADIDSVNYETNQRIEKVAKCTQCNAYSKNALEMSALVITNSCGFDPVKNPRGFDLNNPQWSTNRDVHMRWCFAADNNSVRDEWNNRDDPVKQCVDCRDYVVKTLAVVNDALNLEHCIGAKEKRDPRWSEKAEDHFRWCMGLARHTDTLRNYSGAIDSETFKRNRHLRSCKIATTKGPLKKDDGKTSINRVSGKTNPAGTPSTRTGAAVNRSGSTTALGTRKGQPCKLGQPGDPCTSNTSKIPNPGLLDGDRGFSGLGPSPTGTPSGSVPNAVNSDSLRLR